MRMAGRIGLVVVLAGAAAGVRAQDPPDVEMQQQRSASQREAEERNREIERSERLRERAERSREQAERERERAEAADDRYDAATDLVDEGRWDDAVRAFDSLAGDKGRRADAALYWKAYSQQKLGRDTDALETLNRLRSTFPKSSWVKEAKALELQIRQGAGQAPRPEAEGDEDLKLLAIDGLMNSNPQQAMPLLGKFLESSRSPKLRDRALFVLAQSGSPEARATLARVARGETYPGMQRKAIQYLSMFGGTDSRQTLADIYKSSSDASVKKAVLQAFMIGGDKQRLLQLAKGEPDQGLRRSAIQQLGVMGAQDELWQMYQVETSREAKEAIQQALFVGGSAGRLIELARSEKDYELRLSAVRTLGLMASPETHAALEALYKNEQDVRVREAVLQGFFVSGNVKRLIEIARTEKDPALKRKAVQHLSVMGSPEATQYLMELLEK